MHHCPEPSLMLGKMELWLKRVCGGWAKLGAKLGQKGRVRVRIREWVLPI